MVQERNYESERNCDSNEIATQTMKFRERNYESKRNCDSGQVSFAVLAPLIYDMEKFSM